MKCFSWNLAENERECGNQEEFRAFYEANISCKKIIEAAIAEHYHDDYFYQETVKRLVEQFGYDCPLYVLANTVQEKENDDCVSNHNREWAKTIPVAMDRNLNQYFTLDDCSISLIDHFIHVIRREYAITYHVKKKDIIQEAKRILQIVQELSEPNSSEGTHFIAQFSPGFLARADSRDMNVMMRILPFSEVAFTYIENRKGHFVVIPKDVDRSKPLRCIKEGR